MAKSPLNLGLIGAGRIGRLHAEHLSTRLPGANLSIVTDVNAKAAAECAESFQIPESGTDYRVMLDRSDIQAVVVCSPTDTHTPIIEAAAAAGKHIFCEKPIDFDLKRIDRALEAVASAGVILQIGFNRRFDANFRRIRRAVVEGEIGAVRQLRIISRDPAPPPIAYIKQSGGIFMDMTIHDFDMARFLIGSDVEEVYATGAAMVDPAIEEVGDIDTSVVLLKFANGVMGTIENCRQAAYGYDQRVEVFGSQGSISVDNNYPNTGLIRGRETVYRDHPLNFFMERYTESYLRELRKFLEAVTGGDPSPVTGTEGRTAVVMARAAQLSCEQNRPVRLAEIA